MSPDPTTQAPRAERAIEALQALEARGRHDRLPVRIVTIDDAPTHPVPCLALISRTARPPSDVDALRDWIRADADDADVETRITTLARRAAAQGRPALSIDGELRFAGRSHYVRPCVEPVLARLIDAWAQPIVVRLDDDTRRRYLLRTTRSEVAEVGLALERVGRSSHRLMPLNRVRAER